ncbi:MAG: hypothetical protein DWQ04_14035 [Chloroflexi bacterium]|nr:MAG: hypothetical protein DWQ04_14035 [Chloroflexota bacterium]
MFSYLRQLIIPPIFPTLEETRKAKIIHNLLLLGIVLGVGFALIATPFVKDNSGPVIAAFTSGVFTILFILLRRKKLKFVCVAIIVSSYIAIVISLLVNGGLRDEAALVLIALLAVASFFLGEWATVAIGFMTGLVFIGLFIAEHRAWIPETEHFFPVGTDDLLLALIAVLATTTILRQLMGQLIKGNHQIQIQAQELEKQTQYLKQTLANLQETQADLLLAKETAEDANQAKSDFLSKMSHDLRSPLSSIVGFADALKSKPDLSNKKRAELLGYIERNGQYLFGLIDNLLDLSRIEANKLILYPEAFSLLSCLTEIVTMMQLKIIGKDVQILTEFDDQLPVTWTADEQRLRQVLTNLLENAIKFTLEGSVTLRVCVKTAVSPPTQSSIHFAVIDTGIGIRDDDLSRILNPFEQIDIRSQRGHGTGLGLAICTQLVELMGGKLNVESKVGQGSRFWFDLPEVSRVGAID